LSVAEPSRFGRKATSKERLWFELMVSDFDIDFFIENGLFVEPRVTRFRCTGMTPQFLIMMVLRTGETGYVGERPKSIRLGPTSTHATPSPETGTPKDDIPVAETSTVACRIPEDLGENSMLIVSSPSFLTEVGAERILKSSEDEVPAK
jgi:hypothetical protein